MLRCPLSDHLSFIFLHIRHFTFYLHNITCTCSLSPQTPATCSVSPQKVSSRTRNQCHCFHCLPQNPQHAWRVAWMPMYGEQISPLTKQIKHKSSLQHLVSADCESGTNLSSRSSVSGNLSVFFSPTCSLNSGIQLESIPALGFHIHFTYMQITAP